VFTRFDALGEEVASALCSQVASELAVDDAIFDGEVIAADEIGRPQFYDLLRRTGRAAYVAFDLLWVNGTDLRALPFSERRRRLHAILPAGSPTITEAVAVEGRGRELFDLICVHDLEGVEATAPVLDVAEAAEAVIFHVEQPIRVVERVLAPGRRDRLYPQCHLQDTVRLA
jgi:hypothetical protein